MPLDAEALRLIYGGSHRRRYAAGAVIVNEGEIPTSLYLLAHGQASVKLPNWRGREVLLGYVKEGEFFGEMGLYPGTPARTAMVRAVRECLVVEMPYARFRQLAGMDDRLWLALVGQLAGHLRETNRALADTGFLRVPRRILETLQHLASDQPGVDPAGVRLRVSREELGNLVGCTREVAGRALRQLAADGLIRLDGRAVIVPRGRERPAPG